MWLVLFHLCALGGLQLWTIWRIRHDGLLSLSAFFVLAWTNVVVTALFLSCFSALGNHLAYVGVSLFLAAIFGVFSRASFSLEPRPVAAFPERNGRWEKILRACLWGVIAIVILPTVALCLAYNPDNFDSVAYRLPRAFLYLSQGSLRQLGQADFRMQSYPFNMTLAYLATSIGGLAGPTLNLFSLVTWLVGGTAVARTAREFGAGRNACLFAAAAYLSAPAVLVSASSTNDDMMAGVPLLVGLLFFARWWRSCNFVDAMLAAMGCGLSAGSKLHFPFFLPVALLFAIVVAARWLIHRAPVPALGKRAYQSVVVVLIVGLLGLPALAVNFVQTGRATPDLPNFQNKPFSLAAAATTTAVSSASLFLAPIPDLDLDPNQDRRKSLYDAFNGWQNAHFFSWVSPRLNYSNEPYYRFDGVASSDAYQGLWEQSAWLGFTPWLLLSIPVFAWLRRKDARTPQQDRARAAALWLTAGFFGWHIARCFVLRYVGAAGIYYAYPMAIGAPALAWLWDLRTAPAGRSGTVARIACYGLMATNLVSAANAFLYNQQRNIPDMRAAEHFRPPPKDVVDARLAAHLRRSKNTLVAYTQWELPLLGLIAAQPGAHYKMVHALTAKPVAGYDLSVMLNRQNVDYGEVPLEFADDDRTRLSFLGMMNTLWGVQRAFGHDVHGPVDVPGADEIAERREKDGVVFDYRAGSDGSAGVLAAGWAPADPTHRWSDGARSRIDFYLPAESSGCILEGKAISAGDQTVKVSLNGKPLESIHVNEWRDPGQDFRIPLPDASLEHGATNDIVFSYDHFEKIDEWKVALGLSQAALRCDKLRRSAAELLPPLKPDGFAILQFAEKRDGQGKLTGLAPTSLNGTDPDEKFTIAFSRVSDKTAKETKAPPTAQPIAWNKPIPIPEGPKDGFLRVVLSRVDRPDISARFYIPIAEGSIIDLDTRRLSNGQISP